MACSARAVRPIRGRPIFRPLPFGPLIGPVQRARLEWTWARQRRSPLQMRRDTVVFSMAAMSPVCMLHRYVAARVE